MLLRQMSKRVLLIFYSRNVMVSGFTLKSLICFVFIFVYAVRKQPVSFFAWSGPVSPMPIIEETVFSALYIGSFLSIVYISVGLLYFLSSVPLFFVSVF